MNKSISPLSNGCASRSKQIFMPAYSTYPSGRTALGGPALSCTPSSYRLGCDVSGRKVRQWTTKQNSTNTHIAGL